MSTITNGNEKHTIRLCHIIKWDDYDGYGFNLHAEKSKPGQFIGKVDEGSPAEAAGLKEGDRIIEVNGQSIAGDDHKSVVNKIKQQPNEATLLVVDKASAEYYQSNNIAITSTLPEVITLKTPARPATQTNGNGPTITENGVTNNGNSTPTDVNMKTSSICSESPKSQRSATSSDSEKSKLNLNMSAEEFRNKLSLKKKYDPKKANMDVKLKYEIIDQL